jgi:hypothetical protein
MCVIIHSPDKKHRPSLETLRLCDKRNPHGSGIAWIDNGQVYYLKGLSPEAIDDCLRILEGDVVIHFRFATAGGKDTRLCHPFPVTDDATPKAYGHSQMVLFHNGHWAGYEQFLKENHIALKGLVSDTRVAAIGTWIDGAEFLRTIPGRFVRMSAKKIERLGDWTEHQGMFFSNMNWRASSPVPKLKTKPAPTYKPNPHLPERPRYTGHSNNLVEQAMACFGD